ncbi:MAG: Rid family hydrolase [Ilumatobacteraceae bacterium]
MSGRWHGTDSPCGDLPPGDTTLLEGAGAGFDDVAKLTVYVVDWTPTRWERLIDGATRVAASKSIDLIRPVTLIGVAALGEPDLLIEVEALAVLA